MGSEPALGLASSHLPWHGRRRDLASLCPSLLRRSGQRDLSLCCPQGRGWRVGVLEAAWTHCHLTAPTGLPGLGCPGQALSPCSARRPLCEEDQKSLWSLASTWGLARFCQGGRGPVHRTPILPVPLTGHFSSWEEFQHSPDSGLSSCPLRPFPAVLPWGSPSFRPLGGGPAAPAPGRGDREGRDLTLSSWSQTLDAQAAASRRQSRGGGWLSELRVRKPNIDRQASCPTSVPQGHRNCPLHRGLEARGHFPQQEGSSNSIRARLEGLGMCVREE